MNHATEAIVGIIAAVIGLATLAVVVGKNAQTSSVIQATGTSLSSLIQAAVAPVS